MLFQCRPPVCDFDANTGKSVLPSTLTAGSRLWLHALHQLDVLLFHDRNGTSRVHDPATDIHCNLKFLDPLKSSPYSYAGGDWKIVAGKVGVTRNIPPSSEVLPHCKMLTPIAALLSARLTSKQ